MINTKEVIKTINTIIKSHSSTFKNSLVSHEHVKPNYNNGINKYIVCSLNLNICNEFYKSILDKKVCQKTCPFGFEVTKKSFDTSSNYKTISLFSIINYNSDIQKPVISTPRKLKPRAKAAIAELKTIEINNESHKNYKIYLEGLLETLLIGRIGLTLQSISHQFFTPLQGAMSDVKNIQNNIDIKESTVRLSKNFMTLNKLASEIQLILSTSNEFNVNMLRKVTIHKMIDDIYASLESFAKEKNITLENSYNNYLKRVDAIPAQLHILFSNIIHNAVKYSYNGFDNKPLSVKTNYAENDSYLIINISNEGCKITKQEIEERLLFNLGYRGDYSNDRMRTGSGSGLFISDKIAESHGAKIDVKSSFCGGDVKTESDRYYNEFIIYWPFYIE